MPRRRQGITGRASHRKPKLAHKDAPPGHCRVCGLWCSTQMTGRSRSWHDGRQGEPDCLGEWKIMNSLRSAREAVVKRDGWICASEFCTQAGKEIDHIVPLIDGGAFGLDNLQFLCSGHHKEKTAREATTRAQRRKDIK